MGSTVRKVRVDDNGDLRCWKCGGKSFAERRTTRSKVAVGVGALLTSKKLVCHQCGAYNESGHAKPYKPKGKQAPTPSPSPPPPTVPTVPPPPQAPAGWHPDPTGRYTHRWWDGQTWTDLINYNGEKLRDPNGPT